MQKQPSEGFFKKSFLRNFPEFTKKNICAGISFLIKFNSVDLQLIIKIESLEQVFSCEICKICWNNFFKEHHRSTASDSSSMNNTEGRIAKQNCELLKRAFQVKEQISEAAVRRLQIRCS